MARPGCTLDGCERPHKARGYCDTHYKRWQYQHITKPRNSGRIVTRQSFDLSQADAAWLAGLFEGEGCITDHGGNSIRLTIKMVDRDVIARVAALTNGSIVPESRKTATGKTMWVWTVGWRPDVEELLEVMLPWFGERRRARALQALERLEGQTNTTHVRYGA